MKKNLLLIVSILLSSIAFAQIGIVDVDGNNVENTVIDIYTTADEYHLENDYKIQNLSTTSKTYNLKRYEEAYIEGSQEYYCWTLCLPPNNAGTDYYSVFPGDHLTVAAGADGNYSSPAFHFKPEGNSGEAIYRYIVYNVDDVNDTANITMVYHIDAVGINEYDNNAISNVYPNPANNMINVQSTVDNARFEIYTLVGTKVNGEQVKTVNGKVSIDIAHLPNGVYMLTELESQITRRFIVSR